MMRILLVGLFGILLTSVTTYGFAQTDSEIFPEWIKNTIKFWADGLVTDMEFKNAIEYLIEKQIIVIDKPTVEINDLLPTDSVKVISGISLVGLDLSEVDFTGATIINVDFSGADLSGTDFSGMTLHNVNFTNTNLSNSNLSNQDLSNTEFRGTILKNANLSGTNLSNVYFEGVDLTNANLVLADLTNSKIQYSIFNGIHSDGCIGCP